MASGGRAAATNTVLVTVVAAVVVAFLVAVFIGQSREQELVPDHPTQLEIAEEPLRPMSAPTRLEETSAEFLGLVLDQNGRPFNSTVTEYLPIREEIGMINLADASVSSVEGLFLLTDEPEFDHDRSVIDLDGATEAMVNVIWQRPTGDDQTALLTEIAGARLDIADRQVARWEAENPDGRVFSLGAFTSGRELTPDGTGEDGGVTAWPEFVYLGDLDDQPGDDTLIINGSENAFFETFVGYTDEGIVASVLSFDTYFPWRANIFDGEPPASVTTRENELIECMEGVRPIAGTYCLPGDLDEVLNPPAPTDSRSRLEDSAVVRLDPQLNDAIRKLREVSE